MHGHLNVKLVNFMLLPLSKTIHMTVESLAGLLVKKFKYRTWESVG